MAVTKSYVRHGVILLASFISMICMPNVYFFFKEFIARAHSTEHPIVYSSWSYNENAVPKVLHQIMFNTSIPKRFLDARANCQKVNSGLKFILWNKTMVDNLVENKYPFIKDLFHSYGAWVQRADVARYLVVHYYGGIYIDMDTQCNGNLEELWDRPRGINGKVVVRMTTPWGFSNDFFVAPRFHPFLWDVIVNLADANREYILPYFNILLTTGPMYFWGRFLNYQRPEEFVILENDSAYVKSMHWSSWHNWDGGFFVWINEQNPRVLLVIGLTILFLAFKIIQNIRGRTRRRHPTGLCRSESSPRPPSAKIK